MGRLRSKSGDVVELTTQFVIGRGRKVELSLPHGEVSSRHALIRWVGDHWEIKDLGSRNGTFIDGHKLNSGASAPIAQGVALAFGHRDETWILDHDVAPPCSATGPDGLVIGEGDLLVLPDATTPHVAIFRGTDGWLLETSSMKRPVGDGEAVAVDGVAFILHLPTSVAPTAERQDRILVEDLSFHFGISTDEEHIVIRADAGRKPLQLGARVHHHMLLVLARLHEGGAEGWVDCRELGKMLGVDEIRINLLVFRARRHLAEMGVEDAASLIERRPGSGQMRLAPQPFSFEQV